MVEDLVDPRRREPSYTLGEREMLEGWLEFHRTTLLMKCEGLGPDQLKLRPVPTSLLSLHGLIRHMADVERGWFTRTLLRLPETPYLYGDTGTNEAEFVPLDDADWEADLATWHEECQRSRDNAAGFNLDARGLRRGEEVSLRWIYTHMVEEYARHNGHADLIREMIDGAVGC